MKKNFVSIIIVNYNGKNLLKTILASIKKSAFRDYEVIIVDNNSSDGSQEFIKKNYRKIKLVVNKTNLGYCGINSALKYCKGEYILFLNNDIELDKDCIKNLVKTLKSNKNAAIAAPKLVNFYNKELKSAGTWVSRAFYNGHIEGNGDNIIKEMPYMGVGLIRKEIVDIFGYLFDADYFIYAEDLDLGLRIRLLGMKCIFVPDAIIHHMHAITTQKTNKAFITFLMERNLLLTFFKILSVKNIFLYLPYALFARFIAIIKDIVNFQFKVAYSRIKSILWILFNINFIFKKRQQMQRLRKAGDNYLLEVFSEKYLFKKKFIV